MVKVKTVGRGSAADLEGQVSEGVGVGLGEGLERRLQRRRRQPGELIEGVVVGLSYFTVAITAEAARTRTPRIRDPHAKKVVARAPRSRPPRRGRAVPSARRAGG